MVDLGRWFGEVYVVSAPLGDRSGPAKAEPSDDEGDDEAGAR